jgi:hypothetical protein
MTVSELISQLQEFDGNLEVKIGIQPNYPLQATISNLWEGEQDSDYENTIYIATNAASEYFTKDAWE